MNETIQQTKRIGGSLMVRIPKDIVALVGIREGEYVKVGLEKLRKDYFGTAHNLTAFTKEDRMRSKHE